MVTIHPNITDRAVEVLLVRPRDAWRMLGCGNTHGYALLNAGELESFTDGRARKITVESIHRYIGRKLASAGLTNAGARTPPQPQRRGRPRKHHVSGQEIAT
jgi:hypothetical protein